MRAFYLAYTAEVSRLPRPVAQMDGENLPRAVAEVPWGQNSDLLDKLKSPAERLRYAQAAVENGRVTLCRLAHPPLPRPPIPGRPRRRMSPYEAKDDRYSTWPTISTGS
jgi:hypothetical protein